MHARRITMLATPLAITVALTLSGCATGGPAGGDGDPASAAKALTVSTSANSGKPGLEKVAPMFQQESGIQVTTQFGQLGTPTYTSQLQTQLQGGTAPDVFGAFPGSGTSAPNMGALAAAGSALDLSDTQMAKDLPAVLKPAVTRDDKVYAAVLGLQFGAVIYNTDLFSQYGLQPPKTFDELIALIQQIRRVAPDKTPIAIAGSNQAVGMIIASMAAVNQPGDSYRSTDFAASPAWKGGLQQLVDLQKAGGFAESAPTDDTNAIVSQISSGSAFMVLDVTSRYSAVKKASPDAPIAMFPYPAAQASDTRLMIWPGTTFVANAKTPNPEGAKRFIDYVTSTDVDKAWTEAAGGAEFPPTQLDQPDAWPTQFSPLAGEASTATMIPAVTWTKPAIGAAVGTDLPALLLGSKSVDDVLQDMDSAK